MYGILNGIYGQLRGYDRWRIQCEAGKTAGMTYEQLNKLTRTLFQTRVREAIERFSAYARKVRNFRGSVPGRAENVKSVELPVWTRADQRSFFESLTGPPLKNSFVNATGGSTGVPTPYYVTRESWEWRTAVSDRGYSWAGAQKGRKSLYVWATAVNPPGPMKKIAGTVNGFLQRRVFFDSFNFGNAEKRKCCEVIDRLKPFAIVGFTGNLVSLAMFVRDNKDVLAWKASSAITAAEGLHPGQREIVETYLADELFLSYGSREFMLIGMECGKHCGYHLNTDNLMVEVVDETGKPVPPGESGRILVTDLRNSANPFIRYEIGDIGAFPADGDRCSCGLPFPLLARVDGRLQEIIRLPGGKDLTALFIPHLMKDFKWIDGYQLVQKGRESLIVNLVTREELNAEKCALLEKAMRTKLGSEIKLTFKRVETLQRNRSGKIPIVLEIAPE